MEQLSKSYFLLFIALFFASASILAADNDGFEKSKKLSKLLADGKCSFSGQGGINPFLIAGKLSKAKINVCTGSVRCDGMEAPEVIVMDAYEDGACPTLETFGNSYYEMLQGGAANGALPTKEIKPRAWESISASTMCAYETPVRLAATPAPVAGRETPLSPPHFCAAIVACNTKQADGSWVEQPRTVFACPVVNEKKFVDGREFLAETDFCPSVSECYAQQGPAGFTVTKGKIREATPADAEFLAAKDKKRESNLIPSRGRTLAQGRPSSDGSPTSNASETTPGEVHGPAPVRRDPNYLVTTSDPRPTSAQ